MHVVVLLSYPNFDSRYCNISTKYILFTNIISTSIDTPSILPNSNHNIVSIVSNSCDIVTSIGNISNTSDNVAANSDNNIASIIIISPINKSDL